MRRFAIVFVTAVSMIALTQIASAAPYNWTGFYIGINGGYGTGDVTGTLGMRVAGALGNYDIDGALFGGTVGFNYQFSPNWLLGIEADGDWADVKGSRFGVHPNAASYGLTSSAKIENLVTVRGRVGYTWDRILMYATGGWAWSRVNSGFICSPPRNRDCSLFGLVAALSPLSESQTLSGYVVGGGVEYLITPNLSAKAEYLYVNLTPTDFFQFARCGPDCTRGADMNVIRLGLNWRFKSFP